MTNTFKKRIYLASPFFNEEGIKRVEFFEQLLRNLGFEVFSPCEQQHEELEIFSPEWRKATYQNDIDHLEACDVVVAIYTGNDTGTAMEIGYAIKQDKKVILFHEIDAVPEEEKGVNLMMSDSCIAFLTSYDEAVSYDWVNLPSNNWTGHIR